MSDYFVPPIAVDIDRIYFGKVMWFTNEGPWGYLECPDAYEQVWFHHNDQGSVKFNYINHRVIFDCLPDNRLPFPKPGEIIAFMEGHNKKGIKADPWTSAQQYLLTLNQILLDRYFHSMVWVLDGPQQDSAHVFKGNLNEFNEWLRSSITQKEFEIFGMKNLYYYLIHEGQQLPFSTPYLANVMRPIFLRSLIHSQAFQAGVHHVA